MWRENGREVTYVRGDICESFFELEVKKSYTEKLSIISRKKLMDFINQCEKCERREQPEKTDYRISENSYKAQYKD